MMALVLKLYVSGKNREAEEAVERLRRYCEKGGKEKVEVAVVDVLVDPGTAERNNILATPTLVKESPSPIRKVIGGFTDVTKVAGFLGISAGEGER